MMRRPSGTWSLIVLFALAFAGPVRAGTLKFATLIQEGTFFLNSLHEADREIREATEGRVKLKVYPGGTQGSDAVVLKKMKIGYLDGSSLTSGGLSHAYPDFQIMALPHLFRDYQEVDFVRSRIDPVLMKGLDEKGFVTIGLVEIGFVYIMSSHRIESLENLRQRKTWIPDDDPVARALMDAVGAPARPLPIPDVLTGLQSGLIDTYFNSPVGALVFQWFTRVRYLLDAPLVYTYGVVAFSKKLFEKKVPEEDREKVIAILRKHIGRVDTDNRRANLEALTTLKSQGIEFVPVSKKERKKMASYGEKATRSLMSQGIFSPGLVARVRALTAEYRRNNEE